MTSYSSSARDKNGSYVGGTLERRIGIVLRTCREGAGLTQEEVAEFAGITAPAISMIENGKRVNSIATLQRIATALGQELWRIIQFAESPTDFKSLRKKLRDA